MKLIKITGALLVALMMTINADAQGDTKEQLVVPLSQPGKPFKLRVGLTNGSIKVVTYEGKDIVIDADTDGDLRRKDKDKDREAEREKERQFNRNNNKNSSENTNGMKRIAPVGGLDVSAQERNNSVTVSCESWKRPVNLVIKVPQSEGNLKLETVNSGDITVTGVNGEIEVTNVNGAIYLKDVSGSAVATTINGPIISNFKTVDPKAALAFSTLNGKIDITFPASLKADAKLQSDRGEMYTDFDVEADKSQPKVNKTNQSGLYRINIESWVYGKINGGGPQLMMKTMNGNIYIRKAK